MKLKIQLAKDYGVITLNPVDSFEMLGTVIRFHLRTDDIEDCDFHTLDLQRDIVKKGRVGGRETTVLNLCQENIWDSLAPKRV
jgi:hypothetical protein